MRRVLVSSCLLGINSRYDGSEQVDENILEVKDSYCLIPVCPEQLGGLETPRPPCEISEGKVINKDGRDVTLEFKKGAEETLKIAKMFGCEYAILKERSPSCGCGKIYDGTFSSKLIEGNGITADLLINNGIKVIGESKITCLKK